jgi:hypothetical protein
MNRYKNGTPVRSYALGGPGPVRRIDFDRMLGNSPSVLYDDISQPVTSATPPGAGTQITLSPGADSRAWAPVTTGPTATGTSTKRGVTWNQVGNVAGSIAPFASNIVNAFRRPPAPRTPIMDSPAALRRVDYSNRRYFTNRELSAADVAADRSLPANTAQAVRQYNMGVRLNELGKISDAETQQNIQIDNQQAMMNAQVQAANNQKWEDYYQTMNEREVARQREQSANLANAADKFVAIQTEKRKAKTDVEKAQVLSSLYRNSGVLNRQRKYWKDQGIADPLGMEYRDIKMYGGRLKIK